MLFYMQLYSYTHVVLCDRHKYLYYDTTNVRNLRRKKYQSHSSFQGLHLNNITECLLALYLLIQQFISALGRWLRKQDEQNRLDPRNGSLVVSKKGNAVINYNTNKYAVTNCHKSYEENLYDALGPTLCRVSGERFWRKWYLNRHLKMTKQ